MVIVEQVEAILKILEENTHEQHSLRTLTIDFDCFCLHSHLETSNFIIIESVFAHRIFFPFLFQVLHFG